LITFALYPVVGGRCGCGNPECKNAGKHPAEAWSRIPDDRAPLVPTETQGVGIATGARSGVFVLDIDTKNVDGFAELAKLGDLPDTYAVQTPTGGAHLYFRHPGFPVRNSAPKSNPIAPGLDIRGDGGYVVAPGSPHANGGRYEVVCDAPIADAPSWLLSWPGLKHRGTELAAPAADVEARVASVPKAWRIAKAKAWAATQPPAIEGAGGDGHTFQVVTRVVHDFCLTDQDMIDEALVEWNSRCQPPWAGAEWTHKVDSALNHSTKEWRTGITLEYAAENLLSAEVPDAPEGWGVIDWNKLDPPIRWVVEGVVQEATVSLAFGPPNALKTWTMYLIAAAVASGTPWLGRPVGRGLVVILDYESSERQARRRMRVLQQRGITGIRYVNPKEMLDEPDLWVRLAELKPALVVVDSLSRGMIGRDENDAKAMAIPLDLAKRLARDCGAATIFIHHKNKSAAEGHMAARGSGAITAAAEGWLEFDDFEKGSGSVQRATLRCGRLTESIAFDDIRLELSDEKGLVEVKAAGSEPVSKGLDNRERIFSILRSRSEGVPRKELRGVLRGTMQKREADISELLVSDTLVKFKRDGEEWVMLRPGAP
jgi:hypothetical protein